MAIDEILKITNAKHAAGTTARTQAADVGPQFRNIKSFNNTTSFKHLPAIGIKGNIIAHLKELADEGILSLKSNTKKALIDHVCSCPDIMTRAFHMKNAKKGFLENGMSDAKTGYYPDIHKIIQTCTRKLSKEEEVLILSSFPVLYKTMMEEGYIPASLFCVS